MTVKLCNAPALIKREMVVHEEGEIMQTEQDPAMELSMVGPQLAPLPLVPPPLEASTV